MSDIFTLIIGNYEEKMTEAIELVQSAATQVDRPDEFERLMFAVHDFNNRIETIALEVSKTDNRKGVKKDDKHNM